MLSTNLLSSGRVPEGKPCGCNCLMTLWTDLVGELVRAIESIRTNRIYVDMDRFVAGIGSHGYES
jgi:hypothetical protein